LLGQLRGVMALVGVLILGVIFSPRNLKTGELIFLSRDVHSGLLFEYADYGILACGMTLVILTAGIDLSVGSVLGFVATFFALLTIGYGWATAPAVIAAVLLGGACGAVNGVIIARLRMQPFVATLAMMAAARGAAKWITASRKVQPAAEPWYAVQDKVPDFYRWMTTSLPAVKIQPVAIIFILLVVILYVVVRFTSFGRCLYAVGGNEEASRLSGINVGLTKVIAYTICGACAGLAGVANACRLSLGDPQAGFTYELDAIAAVVIGGTSLMGGRGGMFFTLIGALIVAYIGKILSLNNVPEAHRLMAKGAIIVVAVLIQQRSQK
jgi:ribose transport system permease protein